ncbi:hypothetical protein OG21DRAFT_1514674 [Imleria badia]|nr:hypothetical protein OG21DRAFT_1514674 [Imleria badia]
MPNNVSAPQDTLYVSTVNISLAKDSSKTIESIKLGKNNESPRDVQKTICAGGEHREEFHEPLPLGPNDHIFVSVNCSYWPWWKRVDIRIDINLRDTGYVCGEQGVRLYRRKERNVEVVVAAYCQPVTPVPATPGQLPATTASILEACSQFRLLIIGNSGVGKSSLIRKVFGVEIVDVSEATRGTADIEKEFISATNERFVVHDSLGFEAGDEQNIDIVKQFIARRKAMPQLKDQLHAIWLCLETPYCGGRLLEAGAEKVLQERDKVLGNVPLVVVLTKVDQLDAQLEIDPPENETLENYKSRYLNKYCVEPLRRAAGRDITHVTVSVKDGYSESLTNLVKATKDNMAKYHVDETPWFVASIAQRVSIKEKIELSIAVGKKEYWNILMGAVFRGHTLQQYLHVIRKDVITVWNFNDPDKCLMDDRIFEVLLRTNNLGDTADTQSNKASFADLIASALELLQKGLSGSVDIASVLGFAVAATKAPNKMYQGAKEDVKILMAFIVNLICVMQVIFLLASGGPVTRQTVALAVGGCERQRSVVHSLVNDFDGKLGVLLGGRDYALEQVVKWIWLYSIKDDEIEALKRRMGQVPVVP